MIMMWVCVKSMQFNMSLFCHVMFSGVLKLNKKKTLNTKNGTKTDIFEHYC